MKRVVRGILTISAALLIGFLTLVFSNSDILNTFVVGVVIAFILKQLGLLGSDNYSRRDGDDTDIDWDDDGDD